MLQAAKVPLNEYEFPTSKVANVQSQLEKLVEKNYYLHQSAKDAYRCALWPRQGCALQAVQPFRDLHSCKGPEPCLQCCRSFLLAYNSHQLKDIFNVHTLDLAGVGKSFGFTTPPRVSLNLESKASHGRKAKANNTEFKRGKSGHAFSATNPYGNKQASDKRQFVRT